MTVHEFSALDYQLRYTMRAVKIGFQSINGLKWTLALCLCLIILTTVYTFI